LLNLGLACWYRLLGDAIKANENLFGAEQWEQLAEQFRYWKPDPLFPNPAKLLVTQLGDPLRQKINPLDYARVWALIWVIERRWEREVSKSDRWWTFEYWADCAATQE